MYIRNGECLHTHNGPLTYNKIWNCVHIQKKHKFYSKLLIKYCETHHYKMQSNSYLATTWVYKNGQIQFGDH